ncbi:ATP-binding protein [Streptomyces sennicomposti]
MPRASFTFEATPAEVRRIRGRISAAVRSWDVPLDAEPLSRLELVASELLTNALVHAGGRLTAEVALTGSFVVVEVSDGSPELPRRREAGAGEERGRGLALVEACSLLSGAETTAGGGKRCFAVLVLSADSAHDTPARPPRSTVGDAAGSARWTLTPTALELLPNLLTVPYSASEARTGDSSRPRHAEVAERSG